MKNYFSFKDLKFRYTPYPIGVAKNLIAPDLYEEMLKVWPDTALFKHMTELGDKFALSEKFNAEQYHQFVRSHPIWSDFYKWVKSDEFIYSIMDTLAAHHIDLGHSRGLSGRKKFFKTVKGFMKGRPPKRGGRLKARFEFQMMPETGGHILPHSDTASKFVTIVVSMLREGEWDAQVGGGTDVNQPKDISKVYNWLNRQASFEEMEVLHTYEFEPNQAVVFIKTHNSWHSVRPMIGTNPDKMRRTLIINITTAG